MLNLSYRKVGGLRFLKVGRLTFMFCLSRQYKSLHAKGYAGDSAE